MSVKGAPRSGHRPSDSPVWATTATLRVDSSPATAAVKTHTQQRAGDTAGWIPILYIYIHLPAATATKLTARKRAGDMASLHEERELLNLSLVNKKSWAAPALSADLPYLPPSSLLCGGR